MKIWEARAEQEIRCEKNAQFIKSKFLDTCSDIMVASRFISVKGVILMVYVIVIALIIRLLFPSKGRRSKEKQQSRPWYDISYDDIIKYDMFDDDWRR